MSTQARIKSDYRRNTMVLLSGIIFSKNTWTDLSASQAQQAKNNFADILEFSDVLEGYPQETEEVVVEPQQDEPAVPEYSAPEESAGVEESSPPSTLSWDEDLPKKIVRRKRVSKKKVDPDS